ncbi:endonuclease NucS domain-containing protein [Rhizobium ruizarguesonis]
MLENQIRDLLSTQLGSLDAGLSLIDIEQYIPSELGTRSFIDILARDEKDRWVLIELKRSDAAARQAIHEIYKYVEAVKEHLRARDDEIRAIIVSTEWKELLVPFSRFQHDTSIDVRGMHITVDQLDGKISKTDVQALRINSGRVLSPWHEISLYTSAQRRGEGLLSYDMSCQAKGLRDYILVLMKAPEGFYEGALAATAHKLARIYDQAGADDVIDLEDKMPRREHMIYFVPQMQTAEEYLAIIKTNPELYDEVNEFLDDMEDEEALCSLQEYALHADPKVDRDYFEIGYPAKFKSKLLDSEGWAIEAVLRRGAFERNQLLTDATIISEICGEAGTSGQRFKRHISLGNKAEFVTAISDLEECLVNNSQWLAQISHQLEEARKDFPFGEAEISVYVPTTGVFTLFFAATMENGILYVPTYTIQLSENGSLKRAYAGDLMPMSSNPLPPEALSAIVEKYYHGDLGFLVMTMTSGGYEARDLDILEDLNLTYSSFRCDVDGTNRKFFRHGFNRWRAQDPIAPFRAFYEYLNNNARVVNMISAKLGPRVGGAMCDSSSAVRQLEDLFSSEITQQGLALDPPVSDCAICTSPFSVEPVIVEVFSVDGDEHGLVCGDCAVYMCDDRRRIYLKTESNSWIKVADVDASETEKEKFEKFEFFCGGV